jgi:hypothetical protein
MRPVVTAPEGLLRGPSRVGRQLDARLRLDEGGAPQQLAERHERLEDRHALPESSALAGPPWWMPASQSPSGSRVAKLQSEKSGTGSGRAVVL